MFDFVKPVLSRYRNFVLYFFNREVYRLLINLSSQMLRLLLDIILQHLYNICSKFMPSTMMDNLLITLKTKASLPIIALLIFVTLNFTDWKLNKLTEKYELCVGCIFIWIFGLSTLYTHLLCKYYNSDSCKNYNIV